MFKDKKKKGKGSEQPTIEQVCPICQKPTQQMIILLHSLKNRLIFKIKHTEQEYEEMNQRLQVNASKAFSNLLAIIMGKHLQKSISVKNCFHQKIFRYFRKKMKCSETLFHTAIESLTLQLGSRNYHFELLNQIVTEIGSRSQPKLDFPPFMKKQSSNSLKINKKRRKEQQKIILEKVPKNALIEPKQGQCQDDNSMKEDKNPQAKEVKEEAPIQNPNLPLFLNWSLFYPFYPPPSQ